MKLIMRILLGLGILLGTLMCWSCVGEDRRDEVTIGTFSQAIDYAPFFVAKHFGWFRDAAPRISFREFGDRSAIAAALNEGELQVIFAAAPPLIITEAQGVDVSLVEISCTLQQEIVVRSELPIRSAVDLRGQRVAVLPGTSSHYGLLKTLQNVGITQEDVQLVLVGPGSAEPAFESGEIDAWAVWPPFVEKQQLSGKGRVLSGGDAIIQSVVGMSASFVRNSRASAESVAVAVRRAKAWILQNPEEAEVIVAKELGLDTDVVQLAWGKHDWSARLSPALIQDLEAKSAFLRDTNTMRRAVRVEDHMIDESLGGATPLELSGPR